MSNRTYGCECAWKLGKGLGCHQLNLLTGVRRDSYGFRILAGMSNLFQRKYTLVLTNVKKPTLPFESRLIMELHFDSCLDNLSDYHSEIRGQKISDFETNTRSRVPNLSVPPGWIISGLQCLTYISPLFNFMDERKFQNQYGGVSYRDIWMSKCTEIAESHQWTLLWRANGSVGCCNNIRLSLHFGLVYKPRFIKFSLAGASHSIWREASQFSEEKHFKSLLNSSTKPFLIQDCQPREKMAGQTGAPLERLWEMLEYHRTHSMLLDLLLHLYVKKDMVLTQGKADGLPPNPFSNW